MKRAIAILTLSLLGVTSLFAFGGHGYGAGGNVGGRYDWDYIGSIIDTMPKEKLSKAEINGLLQMREEEKLARDVYEALYDRWHLTIFKNISLSEDRHTNTIAKMIKKYNLKDPIKKDVRGKFESKEMQKLYDALVAQGSKSLKDAIIVGATVEDLDIYDLQKLIKETDNKDVKLVYENLMKGSRNHLRSFVYQLKREGVSFYKAQYLNQEEVNKILATPQERGVYDANGRVIYTP